MIDRFIALFDLLIRKEKEEEEEEERSMLLEKDDTHKVHFNGTDKVTWLEYEVKTLAVARKKKWVEALENDLSMSSVDEDKQKNHHAYYWLLMTCREEAGEYVAMAPDKAHGAWVALRSRYHDVVDSDLASLYTKLTETVNEGPGSRDPVLWYHKIKL